MKRLLTYLMMCFWLTAVGYTHRDNSLTELCSTDILVNSLVNPGEYSPAPRYGDTYWLTLPADFRSSYIKEGERFRNVEWQGIDLSLFAQYRHNGNIDNYNKVHLRKRTRIANLAMAEIMEDKGRFLDKLYDGMQSLCDEIWWGVPADYAADHPIRDVQTLDIYSAETGALLAWLQYMFADDLRVRRPQLYNTITKEVKRRILDEALKNKEWWRDTNKNWNTWICACWLPCVLLVENDRDKQIKGIQAIARSLDGFMDNSPADGGCDEGAMYWDRAAASLFECLKMLDEATEGTVSLKGDDLLYNMSLYPPTMNIDNVNSVDFADAPPRVKPKISWYTGANYIGSPMLMSYVANAASTRGFYTDPVAVMLVDDSITIRREIPLLMLLAELRQTPADEGLLFDTWWPITQVLTARSAQQSTKGLYLAAKGGNNDENHNHNDVGSFIVYADGHPLLIDPGRATYTNKTFGPERYSEWNVQSAYHNLPRINGIDQKSGKTYAAKSVKVSRDKNRVEFTADIAPAYPKEAAVTQWRRNIRLDRGRSVTVTEKYYLDSYKAPTEIILMSQAEPHLSDGKVIYSVGGKNYVLAYDSKQLEASIEKISLPDPISQGQWGNYIYRLHLKVMKPAIKGTIRYSISTI